MSLPANQRWTDAEYLSFERSSEERHELVNGEIRLKRSSSINHNHIVGNLIVTIGNQLTDRPCKAMAVAMRVKIQVGHYLYPDFLALCEPSALEDEQQDSLLNPNFIIEILAESTETFDRGEKFRLDRSLPSLQEYLLIAQDTASIEHYVRGPNDSWTFSEAQGLDAVLELPSIECTLALRDVYDQVRFVEDSSTNAAP